MPLVPTCCSLYATHAKNGWWLFFPHKSAGNVAFLRFLLKQWEWRGGIGGFREGITLKENFPVSQWVKGSLWACSMRNVQRFRWCEDVAHSVGEKKFRRKIFQRNFFSKHQNQTWVTWRERAHWMWRWKSFKFFLKFLLTILCDVNVGQCTSLDTRYF